MRKKALAIMLSSAMFATGILGLATACKNKPGGDNTVVDKPAENFKRLVDPRAADAFEVHEGKEGKEIGKLIGTYPSIADAINAAVYNDLDEFEVADVEDGLRGSYVTKKGSTRKIFENMTTYAAGAGDNFWYYNNNSLAGLEYYPMPGAPYSRAQNTKDIVYAVAGGTETKVETSSYGLYDGLGQIIDESYSDFKLSSRSWELTPGTDASIKGIPVRDSGATGARYELDLSDVKIKPAYQGVKDDVYAFFGYTIGASYYSVEIGVACNVNTGVWRQYISHNPHNNEHNEVTVEYNVGKILFTSTWNEEGGYYTPDVDTVELEVLEVKDEDENAEAWWYDRVTFKADDKEILNVIVDADYIVENAGGTTFDKKNGFYFVAGLDVVAAGAKLGDANKAVDYTNGATFENLVVTKGEIYFHSDDEFTDGEYGGETNPELQGKWHSIRQKFEGKHDEGIYSYTILQLNACVDYKLDGTSDVYSFRYDKHETSPDHAGLLKTYQDKIDALYEINEDNAGEFKDKIAAIEELYKEGMMASSDVPEYCYLVLDWDALFFARDVYKNAANFTEAGEALYAEFEKLTNINVLNGDWKGWKTTETGDAEYGYLYNELELFRVMHRKLTNLEGGLTTDDQDSFARVAGDKWDTWEGLMNGYDALQESSFAETDFEVPNDNLTGKVTVKGKNLFEEYYKLVVEAYANKDDAQKCSSGPGGAFCAEEGWHFNLSFRVLYIQWVLEKQLNKADVSLDYAADLMDMLRDYQTGGDMYLDFRYLAEVLTQINRIITGECTYLDEEIVAVINEYMVSDKYIKSSGNNNSNFNKGSSAYNYANGGEDIKFGSYRKYFLDATNANRSLRELLQDELYEKLLKNSGVSFINVHYQGNDKGKIGLKLDKAVSASTELSQEATTWLASWKATTLTDLNNISAWKGFKASDSDKAGYLADEIEIFGALYTTYQTFAASDKAILVKDIDQDIWAAWSKLLDDYTRTTTGSFKDKNFTVAGESYTGVQIIEELFKAIYSITKPAEGDKVFGVGADFAASFRALYLNEILKENLVEFDYVDELITKLSAGNGANVVDDFTYLYHVLAQVARVQGDEPLDRLDFELANVVNNYMYQVTALKSNVADEAIVTVAEEYFDIDTEEATTLKALVALLGDLIKQGKVELNESGLGVDTKIADEDIPKQDTFTLVEFQAAVTKANLSDLNEYADWKGWKSDTDNSETLVNGYLYDELMMFEELYEMYNKVVEGSKAEALELLGGAQVVAQWVALSTEYAALVEANTQISVWNKNFSAATTMTTAEAFGAFIDGAFFFNTITESDCDAGTAGTENSAHAAQKYLCMESAICNHNTIYTLYLNKVLNGEAGGGEKVTIAHWGAVWDMIKGAGKGVALDFDQIWYMGKQVVRINKGECTYLDAELAAAVNEYMHPATIPTGNVFRNGSLSYWYRSVWFRGCLKTFDAVNWLVAVDPDLVTVANTTETQYINWHKAQKLINQILTDAGYGDKLLAITPAGSGNTGTYADVVPLYINGEVEAQKDPNDKTDEDRMQDVIRSFNALSDLTDLTPKNWLGGSSGSSDGLQYHYVLDEIQMFETIQTAAKAINKEDEVKEAVGSAKYEKWVSALTEYNALKAIDTKYSIVNGNKDEVLTTTYDQATPLVLVNGFFNALFQTYDANIANSKGNLYGYLCMEHKDHFLLSMRALYLRKFIEENEITFTLIDEMLNAAADLESTGTSKYTGVTESRGAIMDFDYLWTMAKEIKRIKDGDIQALDEDLRNTIDSLSWYMRKSTESNYASNYGVSNLFYNLSLTSRYRDTGAMGFGSGWERYLGLDGTQTWNELLAEYINPLLSDEYDLIAPASGTSASIHYVKKSTD